MIEYQVALVYPTLPGEDLVECLDTIAEFVFSTMAHLGAGAGANSDTNTFELVVGVEADSHEEAVERGTELAAKILKGAGLASRPCRVENLGPYEEEDFGDEES